MERFLPAPPAVWILALGNTDLIYASALPACEREMINDSFSAISYDKQNIKKNKKQQIIILFEDTNLLNSSISSATMLFTQAQ